jgi:hypothetical protein
MRATASRKSEAVVDLCARVASRSPASTQYEQENAGPEELIRASYYANDALRRQYGIESRTAMLSDITGLTWGLPRALAGTGTRYRLFGPGAYRKCWASRNCRTCSGSSRRTAAGCHSDAHRQVIATHAGQIFLKADAMQRASKTC